ncbi:hypothetical protein [Rhizobium esperanzae]|uniref:hypothetical protein n=1 Tax=Rhizobium esperanzae TaxID=1967781 RepID=UPI001FD919BA|nr:hypothetical protein [Rhizobium esperanzae]
MIGLFAQHAGSGTQRSPGGGQQPTTQWDLRLRPNRSSHHRRRRKIWRIGKADARLRPQFGCRQFLHAPPKITP